MDITDKNYLISVANLSIKINTTDEITTDIDNINSIIATAQTDSTSNIKVYLDQLKMTITSLIEQANDDTKSKIDSIIDGITLLDNKQYLKKYMEIRLLVNKPIDYKKQYILNNIDSINLESTIDPRDGFFIYSQLTSIAILTRDPNIIAKTINKLQSL
jgi:hypothetical protein